MLFGCQNNISVNGNELEIFKEGLIAVEKEGRYGYINKKGETVINFYYERAGAFKNGIAVVMISYGKFNIIDKKGNTVFSKKDIVHGGGNYYIAYNDNNKKYEVHDKDGEKVDSLEFDYYNTFFENNASVNIDGESLNILFDDNGQLIKSLPINESLFLYNYNMEWSLSILPYLVEYSDSIFSIHTLNGKTILIEGEEIIQTVIDKMFIVKRNGKYGVVDTNDNIKIPFIYDGLFYTGDGYFVTSINNKMGVLDSKGKVIINAEYDEIYPFVSLNTFY